VPCESPQMLNISKKATTSYKFSTSTPPLFGACG
jgi:hypothetical protein